MENRYLFKAQRVDNGEWEIGSLIILPNGKYEIANGCANPPDSDPMWKECVITHIVDPDTICRCTGFQDRNDRLTWENDIAKDETGNLFKAFWQENYYQFSWVCVQSEKLPIGTKWNLWNFKRSEIEVVGNIFDNPELLEV